MGIVTLLIFTIFAQNNARECNPKNQNKRKYFTTKTFEDDLHHDRRNRFLGPCLVSRKKMKRKKKTDTGGVGRLQASK
jgi:hypothetical protein